MSSELLHVLELHAVPLAGVWTVVNVDGTHVYIFLVSTGPDALDLEVELREAAAWHLLVQVAEQIELLLVSNECFVDLFIYVVKE